MMGKQDPQKDLFSYSVGLDKRVRWDNPLRSIDERIDFLFVRDEVEHLYGLDAKIPEHSVLSKARARWRRLWRQKIQDYMIAIHARGQALISV